MRQISWRHSISFIFVFIQKKNTNFPSFVCFNHILVIKIKLHSRCNIVYRYINAPAIYLIKIQITNQMHYKCNMHSCFYYKVFDFYSNSLVYISHSFFLLYFVLSMNFNRFQLQNYCSTFNCCTTVANFMVIGLEKKIDGHDFRLKTIFFLWVGSKWSNWSNSNSRWAIISSS